MTSPVPSPAVSGAVVAALQQALGAEHAAVFGYAALGPQLAGKEIARARTYEAAHRARRDLLLATLSGAGKIADASAAVYPVPTPLSTPLAARRFALAIESACCVHWRYAVAVAAGDASEFGAAVRSGALAALIAGAVRATAWRASINPALPTEPFPGI